MLHTIFLASLAFWIALLPVYLWGYGVSCLIDEPWNRRRFLIGMGLGMVSVVIVLFFAHFQKGLIVPSVIAFFVVIATLTIFIVRFGKKIATKLLSRVLIINTSIIFVLFVLVGTLTEFGGLSFLPVVVVPLLIASLFEESSKHLASIGLMSQEFRFSRRDIVIFTFFVVLGFVFAENLAYFFTEISLMSWVFRSLLTLVAHLFASTLCAVIWWRALSYEPTSVRYVAIFAVGFVIASLVHLGYNVILEQGSLVGLGIYMLFAYVVVTRGLLGET